MKNLYFEKIKREAKIYYSKNKFGHLINQNLKQYLDNEDLKSNLSWYDNFNCVHNNYLLHIYWQHPRLLFRKKLHSLINEKVNSNMEFCSEPSFNIRTKYNQRIKLKSLGTHGTQYLFPPGHNRQLLADKILNEVKISIHAEIETQWSKKGKMISICLPMELRSRNELNEMINTIKQLQRREVTLHSLFPDYEYTNENWLRECNYLTSDRNAPYFEI